MSGRNTSGERARRSIVHGSIVQRAITLAAIVGLVIPATVATLAVVASPAAATQFNISTIAGTGTAAYNGDGIPVSSGVRLNNPTGVAVDAQGNDIIADRDNQRIRIIENSTTNPGYPCGGCTWTPGNIDTIAGTGTFGYNGDNIPSDTAQIKAPADVAVDGSGNVFIADQGNHRVRVIAVSVSNPGYPCGGCTWTPGNIYTVAGTGTASYNGDGIVASSAQLSAPGNIAFDSSGNLLISDTSNGRVRVVAINASNPGYTLGGHNCPCTWTQQQIYTIAGSDTLGYAGDGGAATIIGTGTGAELQYPHGVTTDGVGNVIIGDGSNNRVRIVAVSASNPGYPCGGCTWTTGNIYTIAGTGTGGYNGDDIVATTAKVDAPNDALVDSAGNVLIADIINSRVRIIAVSATNPGYPCGGCTWTPTHIYTIAGTNASGYNGDGVVSTSAQLDLPSDLAFDPAGNLVIADQGNHRVRGVQLVQDSTFTVPATAGNPNGFDTGYVVDNGVSLTATGGWSEQSGFCPACRTADGVAPFGPMTNYLAPTANPYSLVGRLGTSGPWSEIGSGSPNPHTLVGTGELYLAINDTNGNFADNSGSMTVTIAAATHTTSAYASAGPVPATGTIGWEGTLHNLATTAIHSPAVWADPARELPGSASSVPTWQQFAPGNIAIGSPAACQTAIATSTPLWQCNTGTIPAGYSVKVDATITLQNAQPQTITDEFFLEASTESIPCYLGCTPLGGPQQSLAINGLLFSVNAPVSILAGRPLSLPGTTTNSSATATITGIVETGTIDRGHITGVTGGCTFHNNAGTGATMTCPDPGVTPSYDLAPGASAPDDPTIDTTGLGGQTIHYTLQATSPDLGGTTYTLTGSVLVITAGEAVVPATTPTIAPQITAGSNAGWTVNITNNTGVAAHDVVVNLDATVTAPDTSTTPATFDESAMNTALGLDPNAATCTPGAGTSIDCSLPDDIPAHTVKKFTVLVLTDGLDPNTTIAGTVSTSGFNTLDSSGALGSASVVTCSTDCTIGVGVPGDPFASPPPVANGDTQQVLLLSNNTPGGTLPAVQVTLSSIDPSAATDPGDDQLCPASSSTPCVGQISSVVGNFGAYVDTKNPIRVTIVARWGTSVPAGRITMEKSTGGNPIYLNPCVVNPTTRAFNAPCVLPQIVRGTAAAGNLTTYNSILFVGDDIHFARRDIAGVSPPDPPTGVAATAAAGKATVRWKAPTATNGSDLIGYEVTALSGGVVQKVVDFDSIALTQTITGLTVGKTYTFKVAAANLSGLGDASMTSNAIIPTGPPSAPTGVTATAGAARATLKWTASHPNGATVTGYVVTVLVAGVVKKTVVFTTAAVTEVITGLTKGTTYTFKVAGKNSLGTGAASALSNAVKPT